MPVSSLASVCSRRPRPRPLVISTRLLWGAITAVELERVLCLA